MQTTVDTVYHFSCSGMKYSLFVNCIAVVLSFKFLEMLMLTFALLMGVLNSLVHTAYNSSLSCCSAATCCIMYE